MTKNKSLLHSRFLAIVTRIAGPSTEMGLKYEKENLLPQVNSYGTSQTHGFRVSSPLHYRQNIKTEWE